MIQIKLMKPTEMDESLKTYFVKFAVIYIVKINGNNIISKSLQYKKI